MDPLVLGNTNTVKATSLLAYLSVIGNKLNKTLTLLHIKKLKLAYHTSQHSAVDNRPIFTSITYRYQVTVFGLTQLTNTC